MRARGCVYHTPYARMLAEGFTPRDVLAGYLATIKEFLADGAGIAGHNVLGFDIPLLERHFAEFIGDNFIFPVEKVWDTGLTEKARQLEQLPTRNQTRLEFFQMIRGRWSKGIKWNLPLCTQIYRLMDRLQIDPDADHDANYDCVLTHHLLEAQRALMQPVPVTSPALVCAC